MPKQAPLDPAQKKLLEDIGTEIVQKLDGTFFEVEGVPLSTVKYANKDFKKKTLIAGWEFALAYAYVGVRGQLIFGLTPEDAQEYEFAEMNVKELDSAFPFVGAAVAKLYALDGENLAQIVDQIVINRINEIENEAARLKREAEDAYKHNETFGMF